jgi:hypothetical protein
MTKLSTREARQLCFVFLLLEGSILFGIERMLLRLSLVLAMVSLDKVGARFFLVPLLNVIFSPSFFLDIKRCYQVFN